MVRPIVLALALLLSSEAQAPPFKGQACYKAFGPPQPAPPLCRAKPVCQCADVQLLGFGVVCRWTYEC